MHRHTPHLRTQEPARPKPLDTAEIVFVARKRRMGASWGAVAKMLGRSIPDVQAAFATPEADA